jgi:hypothetical protein
MYFNVVVVVDDDDVDVDVDAAAGDLSQLSERLSYHASIPVRYVGKNVFAITFKLSV